MIVGWRNLFRLLILFRFTVTEVVHANKREHRKNPDCHSCVDSGPECILLSLLFALRRVSIELRWDYELESFFIIVFLQSISRLSVEDASSWTEAVK